jgi:hypothetical protein
VLEADLLSAQRAVTAAGRAAQLAGPGRQLGADMSAFKSANPGATFADFLSWHSPSDVSLAEDGSAVLSPRMAPGSLWAAAWDRAEPVEAQAQVQLFQPGRVAAMVAHELIFSTTPAEVAFQAAQALLVQACAALRAAAVEADLLVAVQQPLLAISAVCEQLGGLTAAECVPNAPPIADFLDEASQLLREAGDIIASAELRLGTASALQEMLSGCATQDTANLIASVLEPGVIRVGPASRVALGAVVEDLPTVRAALVAALTDSERVEGLREVVLSACPIFDGRRHPLRAYTSAPEALVPCPTPELWPEPGVFALGMSPH